MAWTSPKTWAASEVLTAADMNTYVRDNEKQLLRTLDVTSTSLTGGTPPANNELVHMQAGYSTITAATGGTAITFPTAFSNGVIAVNVDAFNSVDMCLASACTTSAVTVKLTDTTSGAIRSSGTYYIMWIAIGW